MAKKKNKSNIDGSNNDGGRGDGNKENGGTIVVVLKVDLHCEGCAGKVVKAIRSLDGVDSVRIGDTDLNKLTVTGKLDPSKLRQKVEEKTKKKVEIVSPATKKNKTDNDGDKAHLAAGGEDKKQQKQQQQKQTTDQKKTADKKEEKKPKELPMTMAVLKVPLHCQGCIQKIHKLITKTKGYTEMSIDKNKDLVTVKGAMDVKVLAESLKDKLKRPIEILPAKKDGDGGEKKGKGGGDKKGKGGGGGGGEDDGEGNDGGGGKVEGRKMEHYGVPAEYPYQYPQYVYGPGYMSNYVHAPQLFSDENPNACSVM